MIDSSSLHSQSLREEILAKARTLNVLPTLRIITDCLLGAMNDGDSSFGRFLGILKYDWVTSSKIIGIANSAYYSKGSEIVDLEKAIRVIGFEETKHILISLSSLEEMQHPWKPSQDDLAVLWMHSLAVGCAAEILSRKTIVEDPGKVFAASIVHDIGKIFFSAYGEQYRKIEEKAAKSREDLCRLEREAFGIDHQEAGHVIAMKWRLPEEFSAVIREHHGTPDGRIPVLDLVRAANAFVNDPRTDLGAAGIILQKEEDRIAKETNRIGNLLGVVDGRA